VGAPLCFHHDYRRAPPRCPIEIAGFRVVSLSFSLSPFLLLSSDCVHSFGVSRSFVRFSLPSIVRGSGTHFTFARFPRGGWLSKLSFETCTFVALTLSRTSGALYFNHILRENGTDTWNSFSRMDFCTAATCGHAYLFVGKTILSGASVASVSRSLAPALPNSL